MTEENFSKKPATGRPAYTRALATHRGKQLAFNKAINRYVNLTMEELRTQAKRSDLPVIEIIATQVLIRAAESGDPRRTEMVLYSNLQKIKSAERWQASTKAEKAAAEIQASADLPSPSEFANGEA